MPRAITFFVSDSIEELTVSEIADEARRRDWAVTHQRDLSAPAEIGFYVSHVYDIPIVRASFSVVMLHDLGQQQTSWPNFWQAEPWSAFDVGLLPGPRWQAMYDEVSAAPAFSGAPRLGVYEVGWPKADRLCVRRDEFNRELNRVRSELRLPDGPTILYAPSYENDGKQDDVVQACSKLPVNLLIKQAPWSDAWPDIQRNIREMADRHRGLPRVHLLDPELDIMSALGLADLLITDESCVMFESLLQDVPTLSVQDWLVPCENPPRRVQARHEFAIRTTRANLGDDIRRGLEAGFTTKTYGLPHPLSHYQSQWFSHRGRSAIAIMDLIEWTAGSHPESRSGPGPRIQRWVNENTRLVRWRKDVEASLSWRMTRPLRGVIDRFRRTP